MGNIAFQILERTLEDVDAFDGRLAYHWCRDPFYDEIPATSRACSDCWAQSAAAYKAIAICKDRVMDLKVTLSSYHALVCTRTQEERNCYGSRYQDIQGALQMGLVTGSNIIGVRKGCKSFGLPRCKPPHLEPTCPNIDKAHKHVKYDINYDANCTKSFLQCDDPSQSFEPIGAGMFTAEVADEATEEMIKDEIRFRGSVITAYYVGPLFKHYINTYEIFTKWEKKYVPRAANHYMLLIGWGTEIVKGQSTKYWIGKNSWSRKWGSNGYFRIERGKNLNGVERTEIFRRRRADTCDSLAHASIRKEMQIENTLMACFTVSGGKSCPERCSPVKFEYVYASFACFPLDSPEDRMYRKLAYLPVPLESEYYGTVRKISVPVSCEMTSVFRQMAENPTLD